MAVGPDVADPTLGGPVGRCVERPETADEIRVVQPSQLQGSMSTFSPAIIPEKASWPQTMSQVWGQLLNNERGGVLLSHQVPLAVPSALAGLASGFGMGPGVSPPP